MEATHLITLLGKTPDEVKVDLAHVCGLAGSSSVRESVYDPTVQAYPEATYHTYYRLGLSLCYTPSPRDISLPTLSHIDIVNPRDGPSPATAGAKRGRRKDPLAGYTAPRLPIAFRFPDDIVPTKTRVSTKPTSSRCATASASPMSTTTTPNESTAEPIRRNLEFDVGSSTSGKDFVAHFGEPSKKSEGEAGYVESSLEWDKVDLSLEDGTVIKVGIMVDLREAAAAQTNTGGTNGGPGPSVWDRAGCWGWSTLKLFIPATNNAYGKF